MKFERKQIKIKEELYSVAICNNNPSNYDYQELLAPVLSRLHKFGEIYHVLCQDKNFWDGLGNLSPDTIEYLNYQYQREALLQELLDAEVMRNTKPVRSVMNTRCVLQRRN